jgi:hypothetical protein
VFDLTQLYEDVSASQGAAPLPVKRVDYDDVMRRRREGESSTYYARATSTSSWFRITASPVLGSSILSQVGRPRIATFGVLTELLPGETAVLMRAIQKVSLAQPPVS